MLIRLMTVTSVTISDLFIMKLSISLIDSLSGHVHVPLFSAALSNTIGLFVILHFQDVAHSTVSVFVRATARIE